jgi:hypothetical protein
LTCSIWSADGSLRSKQSPTRRSTLSSMLISSQLRSPDSSISSGVGDPSADLSRLRRCDLGLAGRLSACYKYQPATALTSTSAPAINQSAGIRRQKGRVSAASGDHGGVQPGMSPSVGVDTASVAGPSGRRHGPPAAAFLAAATAEAGAAGEAVPVTPGALVAATSTILWG